MAEQQQFKRYRRKGISELRPFVPGEDMTGIALSPEDVKAGSPKPGDWIARNPNNHDDKWIMSGQYFIDAKLEEITE